MAAPPRKHAGPGQPWLDHETAHLIEAYEERWYALKRGQLKAHQWEEVAGGVADRLGLAWPHKSGTQCRHKIEKLRQRYRAERQRAAPSRWPFFDRMDRMERGPLPISSRPPPMLPPPTSEGDKDDVRGEGDDEDSESGDDSSDEDVGEGEEERANGNTRSISGILSEDNWGYPKISMCSRYWEEGSSGDGEMVAVRELVVTVQRFRERLVRMEKRKLELMREVQRDWMEMEARRAEMVAASQQHMLDTVARAFRSMKKPRNRQDV